MSFFDLTFLHEYIVNILMTNHGHHPLFSFAATVKMMYVDSAYTDLYLVIFSNSSRVGHFPTFHLFSISRHLLWHEEVRLTNIVQETDWNVFYSNNVSNKECFNHDRGTNFFHYCIEYFFYHCLKSFYLSQNLLIVIFHKISLFHSQLFGASCFIKRVVKRGKKTDMHGDRKEGWGRKRGKGGACTCVSKRNEL